MRALLVPALLLLAAPAAARDCKLEGVDINPDNASYYAGKSGRIKCYDEAGELVSEEEVRNGEIFGYERRKDLWSNWTERTTNANRNTHGVRKEFWPDGTLKSEGNYDDGKSVGVSRSFHKNGKLERVGHAEGAALEYDADGHLKSLRCAAKSLLAEDKAPCGFGGGAITTDVYRNGRVAERVTYRAGKLVQHLVLDESRAVTASSTLEDGGEMRRTFHPNGKPATELRVVEGWHVEEREWFMNGQLKTYTVREPKERDGRVEITTYRDDGTLAAREILSGRNRVTATLFDEAGKQKQIDDFAPEGHLLRRRLFAPGGAVTKDESFYPDGSRKE